MSNTLEALRELAKGFDAEERAVILKEMPVSELIEALNNKCEVMASKIKQIEGVLTHGRDIS